MEKRQNELQRSIDRRKESVEFLKQRRADSPEENEGLLAMTLTHIIDILNNEIAHDEQLIREATHRKLWDMSGIIIAACAYTFNASCFILLAEYFLDSTPTSTLCGMIALSTITIIRTIYKQDDK